MDRVPLKAADVMRLERLGVRMAVPDEEDDD